MPNEHIFEQKQARHAHTVTLISKVRYAWRTWPHMDADGNVKFFCEGIERLKRGIVCGNAGILPAEFCERDNALSLYLLA